MSTQMDAMEAILTRRSIRAYRDEPIPGDILERILQAAAAAPSGGNQQPWAFIAVCDRARLRGLVTLAPGLSSLPGALIAICLDESRVRKTRDEAMEYMVWMDLGAAMENILLAAHSFGLGACAIGSFHEEALSRLLRLPAHQRLALLVAIGAPARAPGKIKKRPLEEVVSIDEYGRAKPER